MIFITVIFSIVIISGVLILFFLPPFSLCFFLSPPIKRIRLVRETVAQSCSVTKVFLEISQNSQENTCAQVFSCEFCEISKNTFVTEQLWATVSLTNLIRLIGGERKKQSEKGGRKNRIKTPLMITMEKITVMKIINRWKYK